MAVPMVAAPPRPATLRARLQHMPPVHIEGLWENKREALINLERSLAEDRPRALIQMATGSGKTMLAVTALYRLTRAGRDCSAPSRTPCFAIFLGLLIRVRLADPVIPNYIEAVLQSPAARRVFVEPRKASREACRRSVRAMSHHRRCPCLLKLSRHTLRPNSITKILFSGKQPSLLPPPPHAATSAAIHS
ncbi:MAG TPA: DEAD/DEAH box helicase family protein, partial [Vicinamibacteria bacterium]